MVLLAQLLPIDPQVAIDATKAAYEGFRKDFIIATVIMLIAQNVLWAWFHWTRMAKLDAVQEARVQDGKDGERRAEKLADRMAVVMDRSAESSQVVSTLLLAMQQNGDEK